MKYPNSLTSKRFRYSLAVLPFLFTGLLQADINTGLVAHYEFEDNSNDTSTYNFDGNDTSVNYEIGKFGQAAIFDGTNSFITAQRSVQDDFTISFWIKTNQSGYGTNAWDADQLFDADTAGDANDFSIGIANDGKLAFGTGDTTAFYNGLSSSSINTDTWQHITVTRAKTSGENKIYVNGIVEKTWTGSTQTLNAQTVLGIGEKSDRAYKKFNGSMDDVRIYDRTLSSDDVTELFNYIPPLTLTGTSGADTLTGATNNDILSGLDGDDTLNGGDGDDILIGGAGDDIIDGGAGEDSVDYSAATSAITLDLSNSGTQTISGEEGTDTLNNIENIIGSGFNDTIVGDTSNNSLNGGAGDDILTGKAGNDYLDGGDGEDTLILSGNQAEYTIVENQDTTYTVTGTDGTDTIINVELVSFDDVQNVDITTIAEQWQETTYPAYQGLFIPIFQYALTSIQYSDTNAQPLDMSSYYFVETYLDSNSDQILRIDKVIPQTSDGKIYSIGTQTKPDGTITSIEQEEDPITISTNIVSLQKNGTDIFELKLASTLDNNALDSLYSASNGIDINVTFPNDSIGYELYEKEFLTQCHTWQQSNSNTPYTDLATFKTAYTYDAQNQNVLQYSKHSNYKMIQFANDGSNDIVEYDSQNLTLNTVGTWSEISNQVCKNESTNTTFTSNSIIKLNLTVDGYENIAFIKNSNNEYVQGEYIQAGTTTKKYALNDTAAKYLASQVGLNAIPTLAFPITKQWTYLSLPTNNTLCTSDWQSELTNICDQNNTIDALFANVDMVLKYSDSWSYWEPSSTGTYNMNRFRSINHKEGLLIKATNQTTLNLPYDIFSLYPEKSYPIYTQGWYLGSNLFDMKPSDVKTNVDTNTNFTLKYILQLNNTNNWKVYAPLNNSEVNNDIERINTLDTMKSFWIYTE